MTLQISTFVGGPAFSPFKTQQILNALQTVCPQIQGLHTEHVYLLATEQVVSASSQQRMASLLDAQLALKPSQRDQQLSMVVSPRMGTVSPWASKATDIARNCGFSLRRLERLTVFQLQLSIPIDLSESTQQSLEALLHDRMTESVWSSLQDAHASLRPTASTAATKSSTLIL